nr:TPA: gp09-like protein [Oryctes rhinoceros nudivirus]
MHAKPFVSQFGTSYLSQFNLTAADDDEDDTNGCDDVEECHPKNTNTPSTDPPSNSISSTGVYISKAKSNDESQNQITSTSDQCKTQSVDLNSINKSVFNESYIGVLNASTKKRKPISNDDSRAQNVKLKRPRSNQIADSKIIEPNLQSSCAYVNKCVSKQSLIEQFTPIVEDGNPKCIAIGKELKIGKDVFISKNTLYKITMSDYTIISDAQFDVSYAPTALKPLLAKKWVYKLHVDQTVSSVITRSTLRDRVIGGQILAYRYTECSIAGNSCVYYGFIPTIVKRFDDSHSTCYISSVSVWPRKLYVYLKRGYACACSPGCCMWTIHMDNYSTTLSFCAKKIKWDKIYVMMGDYDTSCVEQLKPIRSCEVCAQCFDCSKNTSFCRKHRICKHKTAKPLEDVLTITKSSMKQCKKYLI